MCATWLARSDASGCFQFHTSFVYLQADMFNDKTIQQMTRMIRDKEIATLRKVCQGKQR